MENPRRLLSIGVGLLIAGAVLPFLMVLRLLEPTLFLCFLAYGCSTVGFITGFIGIALYSRSRK